MPTNTCNLQPACATGRAALAWVRVVAGQVLVLLLLLLLWVCARWGLNKRPVPAAPAHTLWLGAIRALVAASV